MDNEDRVTLTSAEAACLQALGPGAKNKSRVAVEAGLDLKRTDRALRSLERKGLAAYSAGAGSRSRWTPTEDGAAAAVALPQLAFAGVASEIQLRRGGSTERVLRALDRPKHVSVIAAQLGITRQRAHQVIVRLLALGLVRSADPERPTRIVARAEDASLLLRGAEERALSAFPVDAVTDPRNLARRLGCPPATVEALVAALVERGLVERSGGLGGAAITLALTPAGAAHPQRAPGAKRAAAAAQPRLPVKSDRVRSVLAHLADHGPVRTTAVGQALGIERATINALMQYLKRRGLAEKVDRAVLAAPHRLTEEGRRVLEEMRRRTATGSGPG